MSILYALHQKDYAYKFIALYNSKLEFCLILKSQQVHIVIAHNLSLRECCSLLNTANVFVFNFNFKRHLSKMPPNKDSYLISSKKKKKKLIWLLLCLVTSLVTWKSIDIVDNNKFMLGLYLTKSLITRDFTKITLWSFNKIVYHNSKHAFRICRVRT